MKLKYGFAESVAVLVLVAALFTFYMEFVYLPYAMPRMYFEDYRDLAVQMAGKSMLESQMVNVSGVSLFMVTVLCGRDTIHKLESYNCNDIGCISDFKREVKEI